MDAWSNAVNSEFIDNLIDEIEILKSEYKNADRRILPRGRQDCM